MWEEGEFSRNMARHDAERRYWDDVENTRRKEEDRRREAQENSQRQAEERNRQYAENQRWQDAENERRNNYSSYSRPKDDGNIHYTITVPSSSHHSSRNILTSIIGAVILSGVLGNNFGLFGYIGGAVGGWILGSILGGFIGKKFLVALVILGVLGGGLYMARPFIVPLFFSLTSKASKVLPLSGNTTTITGNVNFRTEPSMDSPIIKTLQQGDIVISTGEISNGWTQITHNGDTGWVSSEFVKQ